MQVKHISSSKLDASLSFKGEAEKLNRAYALVRQAAGIAALAEILLDIKAEDADGKNAEDLYDASHSIMAVKALLLSAMESIDSVEFKLKACAP